MAHSKIAAGGTEAEEDQFEASLVYLASSRLAM